MARGGQQTPSNPAPVSGPGAMSRRTDGAPGQPVRDPGGLPYGDNAELRGVQESAPMSGGRPGEPVNPHVPLEQMSPDLFAPTDRPDEPVTSGMPFGPGGNGGEEPIPAGPTRQRLAANLPVMLRMAESPYVSPEFKVLTNAVRMAVNGG